MLRGFAAGFQRPPLIEKLTPAFTCLKGQAPERGSSTICKTAHSSYFPAPADNSFGSFVADHIC
ncbi:hypothetical protein AB833_30455 [Chromatiales bacterium (ex Bugula neritina AB1)]|nr:hypothetical protein AB833_30455 [Chromatiales bacterium (ex Bugula neritina AB1)]